MRTLVCVACAEPAPVSGQCPHCGGTRYEFREPVARAGEPTVFLNPGLGIDLIGDAVSTIQPMLRGDFVPWHIGRIFARHLYSKIGNDRDVLGTTHSELTRLRDAANAALEELTAIASRLPPPVKS